MNNSSSRCACLFVASGSGFVWKLFCWSSYDRQRRCCAADPRVNYFGAVFGQRRERSGKSWVAFVGERGKVSGSSRRMRWKGKLGVDMFVFMSGQSVLWIFVLCGGFACLFFLVSLYVCVCCLGGEWCCGLPISWVFSISFSSYRQLRGSLKEFHSLRLILMIERLPWRMRRVDWTTLRSFIAIFPVCTNSSIAGIETWRNDLLDFSRVDKLKQWVYQAWSLLASLMHLNVFLNMSPDRTAFNRPPLLPEIALLSLTKATSRVPTSFPWLTERELQSYSHGQHRDETSPLQCHDDRHNNFQPTPRWEEISHGGIFGEFQDVIQKFQITTASCKTRRNQQAAFLRVFWQKERDKSMLSTL